MTKHCDSVTGRLAAFFVRNPDEELTYDLITQKFDCHEKTARDAVKKLIKRGALENLYVIRTRAKGQGK